MQTQHLQQHAGLGRDAMLFASQAQSSGTQRSITAMLERRTGSSMPQQQAGRCGSFPSKEDALLHFEARKLLRIAFYDGLGRRPPTSLEHMPSYVRAVQQKWDLKFKNSARRLLAQIEGYDSWAEMMSELDAENSRTTNAR